MSRAQEIRLEIMNSRFDNDDLNEIVEGIKWARSQLSRTVARSLQVGDSVKFQSTRTNQVYRGTIEKIKIKNAVVVTTVGRYNVPMNMLEAV